MREAISELLKKFEQEHEIYVDAQDLESYWVINARVPKRTETLHNAHRGRKYITTRNEGGSVLIVPNPQVSDAYFVENWGVMDTFEDFVDTALARILDSLNAAEQGEAEGCSTGCT
ncbi:MAG: hypothetical protein LUQ71_07595 [Methanoregula sp.]|nr:hypothetical protein [Methanoregula sp.]